MMGVGQESSLRAMQNDISNMKSGYVKKCPILLGNSVGAAFHVVLTSPITNVKSRCGWNFRASTNAPWK